MRNLVNIFIAILCLFFQSSEIKGQTIKADSMLPTDYGACVICNGEVNGINIDETYAMHSVMKFPQALFVADCLKRQATLLDDSILVKKENLMQETWSPMLKMFDIEKHYSIAELLQLSLQQSDNNACDLLFERFGGPEQVGNKKERDRV